MKKTEVATILARQTGMRTKDMKIVIDKLFDLLIVELLRGKPVIIQNFGMFRVTRKAGYTWKNGIFKGKSVPEYTHVRFRMHGLLKTIIRERDAKRNSETDNKKV
jgi:nucleoid DNA-binding protein